MPLNFGKIGAAIAPDGRRFRAVAALHVVLRERDGRGRRRSDWRVAGAERAGLV